MKQKHKDKKHKRSNKQPLLIVGSTSLDGGEGGGVMTLSGGLGPAPPFFLFLERQSASFSRQLETSCLLYHLRLGAILQYAMMHK